MFDFAPQLTRIVIFDAEATVQRHSDKIDGSPFNPKNRLVSGHWCVIEVDLKDMFAVKDALAAEKEVDWSVWYHVEQARPETDAELKYQLSKADMFVAHNAKFDALWLTQAGFELPPVIYCTMIGEYILARGQKTFGLSLRETAERRDVTRKKSDLVDDMFRKQKMCFSEMPLDIVVEYAESDVISCAEIFLQQILDFMKPENYGLNPTVRLMNEMLLFLVEIESNGIAIDLDELAAVEKEYLAEQKQLQKRLEEIVEQVMGDTPINLNSGGDLTKVIYSREVPEKKLHHEVFRIGTNAAGKPLYPPKMNKTEFAAAVRATTRVVQKTTMHCCGFCSGRGTYYRKKKNGENFKSPNKCPECGGSGVVYIATGQTAGLRLVPEGPADASFHGFKTDKETIQKLIHQAEEKGRDIAVEFLEKMSRLNAISTYLSSFVGGIQFWTRNDGILHANFNQCVAATGRLSSSDPNFQNQPKGGKFPVRRAIVSRFKGGEILEADYSGLEFRVAGELSRDAQIIEDILNGKDVHKQTAQIIFQCVIDEVTKDMRQASKRHTFGPLYGGMGASEAKHVQAYYVEFWKIYKGHAAWVKTQCDKAMKDGIIRIPSGREYKFEGVRRIRGGRVSQQTKISNFPIQGFATGDIVPLACVRALREFRRLGLKSLLILTVHDSIVVDVYPGEREQVVEALRWAMEEIPEEMKERWNYEPVLPLAIEMEAGPNWMEQKPVEIPRLPLAA